MILSICLNSSLDTRYTVPHFACGGTFAVSGSHVTAGGKGFNLARVASMLGEETVVTGLVGQRDEAFFAAAMAKVGAQAQLVGTPCPTRRCLNIVDPGSGSSTQVLEAGSEVSGEDLATLFSTTSKLAARARVICASGSVPPGVPNDIYAQFGHMARQFGKPFLLDARGVHLREGLAGQPFAVKPNLEELEAYMGKKVASSADVRHGLVLLSQSTELPIVTLGSRGAAFAWQRRFYKIDHPPLQAVNAVGSGDAFMAGLAAGMNRGMSVFESLRLATACGISNASHKSTGFICREQVAELLPLVSISEEGNTGD